MLMRTYPFRELDRFTQQFARPATMPMDAFRSGDEFVVRFDLPGVSPESIDLNVERNVLTVQAERTEETRGEFQVAERSHGKFSRQLVLRETLDTDRIEASYDAGVLTLRIPVAQQAKPRKIAVTAGSGAKDIA
jgi:HSP20 family protein